MKKFRKFILTLIVKNLYKDMPFCVYPIFRVGKAGYDSYMIKGYTYTLLTPNKGTKNIIHLMWCDFVVHEGSFIDTEDGVHKIEDSDQPFFGNWIDAYNDALKKIG